MTATPPSRTRLALALAAALAVLPACSDATSPDTDPTLLTQSFEQGLGPWTAQATDVIVGGEEIDWSVSTSDARATEGTRSVRFEVENLTDAAKVWIEREVALEPNTTYDVQIAFDFGTGDWGSVNLWTILAGAFADAPTETADLQPAFRGNTGHDQGEDAGVVWLEKSYDLTTTTDADGMLHLVIGVWGTYEVTRSYWVDDVRVTITPRS